MYGNIINRVMERCKSPDPEVGMGATITCYSDRHAATVVAVRTAGWPTFVEVQEDFARRTDNNGASETQVYEYAPNPNGRIRIFGRKDASDRWREYRRNEKTGRLNLYDGDGLLLGERDHYYDFSF